MKDEGEKDKDNVIEFDSIYDPQKEAEKIDRTIGLYFLFKQMRTVFHKKWESIDIFEKVYLFKDHNHEYQVSSICDTIGDES